MEEDGGVKAPVTRLRRRLSTEVAEDSKSPVSTPTKKRGRLAAKPQLELIDEDVPKRTPRKSLARDLAESEERPVTPSRRSTRIKSNTSIVSETAQTFDSPRAKRAAARRNSQVGSDTEATLTPARTRRTRKDSTSSVDKQDSPVSVTETTATPGRTRRTRKVSASNIDKQVETAGKPALITEVISEEPENNTRKSITSTEKINESDQTATSRVRKSPRLAKNNKKSLSKSDIADDSKPEGDEDNKSHNLEQNCDIHKVESQTETDDVANEKLSISNTSLIKQMETEPKKKKDYFNKSTTLIQDSHDTKTKRHRTKSWTTLSMSPSSEGNLLSDNENTKTKKSVKDLKSLSNQAGSGDGLLNTSSKVDTKDSHEEENADITITSPTNKKHGESFFTIENNKPEIISGNPNNSEKPQINSTNVPVSVSSENSNGSQEIDAKTHNSIAVKLLFDKSPSSDIQSTVLLEDSDSNTDIVVKTTENQMDGDDQCVPVVNHKLVDSSPEKIESVQSLDVQKEFCFFNKVEDDLGNNTCEPMDIDETMPQNVSLTQFNDGKRSRKSSLCIVEDESDDKRKSNKSGSKSLLNTISQDDEGESNNSQLKKSFRKSSLSNSIVQNVEAENIFSNSFNRKSSLSFSGDNESANKSKSNDGKSKRKSSISNSMTQNVEEQNLASNKSNRNSLPSMSQDLVNESNANESKRKSSICNDILQDNEMESNDSKYEGKSSLSNSMIQNVEGENIGSNKSKRKSSMSNTISQDDEMISNDSKLKKSKRKSSLSKSMTENDDEENKKSSRKSSMSNSISQNLEEGNENSKRSNKSKRNSSISQYLEKTENENKSTLILSQIKDLSSTENNVTKSPQISNNELSKSLNVPDVAKKDNTVTNNYSTSTPVHQKDIKKLGLQMNTSGITPNNHSKNKIKNHKDTSKKNESLVSKSSYNSDSSEDEEDETEEGSESDEESSRDSSNLMDDAADDAGDDYQSGDSLDEDERQYLKENEIVDKGVTLTSEEEYSDDSDDSDYEKGSFIVSSDTEDDELLSGSEDDLGSSDNELTMSAKSKKKYNERKLKEQKKASKEMYESRHSLNNSRKDSKKDATTPKKKNRLRLDSTDLESEDEIKLPPKKNKRMRLESTIESEELVLKKDDSNAAVSDSEEIGYKKKKKSKRLSESICNESSMHEKEITVCEENTENCSDPLAAQIKLEPKTPQKDLNLSTVHFTDRQQVENVEVDENTTIMKPNDTLDPLKPRDDDSDEESISENEEIGKNYDSVLEELNKDNKPNIKSGNISLNLNKKSKKKSNDIIIEQLNLTQTKQSMKKKKKDIEAEKVEEIKKPITNNYDEDSSDSTLMRLMFSDESNGLESRDQTTETTEENLIPLKRTEGKTDIRRSLVEDETPGNDSILNTSNKKKKKRKSSQNEIVAIPEEKEDKPDEEEPVNFFIDTTGTLESEVPVNTSLNASSREKKNKRISTIDIDPRKNDDDDDAPTESSYKRHKNKAKDMSMVENNTDLISLEKTPATNKKIKKKLSKSHTLDEAADLDEVPSEENKSKNASVTENDVPVDSVLNKTSSHKKKKKILSTSLQMENLDQIQPENSEEAEIISKKRKRRSSANKTIEAVPEVVGDELEPSKTLIETVHRNQKKKLKISRSDDDLEDPQRESVQMAPEAQNESKKKKKRSINKDLVSTSQTEAEKTTVVAKKRKERDDDDGGNMSKVLKENSLDKIHVPRLPSAILNQLEAKPSQDALEKKKSKIVSTTKFLVEETKKRRNKPSDYLEESVYLNDEGVIRVTKKQNAKHKPKVLPFMPTASTSDKGFTTNFQVMVVPKKMEFVAKSSDVQNFKNSYLKDKKIKKMRTYELYKNHRNVKLSKF